jgi:hypothetical protein
MDMVGRTRDIPFETSSLHWYEPLETQIKIHNAKIPIFTISSSKRNQNPSRYYFTSITNPPFQHKPKVSHSFKNPHIKIELLYYYLGGAKIP